MNFFFFYKDLASMMVFQHDPQVQHIFVILAIK